MKVNYKKNIIERLEEVITSSAQTGKKISDIELSTKEVDEMIILMQDIEDRPGRNNYNDAYNTISEGSFRFMGVKIKLVID